jgi:hypothetical protein
LKTIAKEDLFRHEKFIKDDAELSSLDKESFVTKRLRIKGPKKWWGGHKEIVWRALAIKRNDCNTTMKKGSRLIGGMMGVWCFDDNTE